MPSLQEESLFALYVEEIILKLVVDGCGSAALTGSTVLAWWRRGSNTIDRLRRSPVTAKRRVSTDLLATGYAPGV